MPFIQVTTVTITPGGVSELGPKVISVSHVVVVAPGTHDTTHIKLEGGPDFIVKESYNQVQRLLGM